MPVNILWQNSTLYPRSIILIDGSSPVVISGSSIMSVIDGISNILMTVMVDCELEKFSASLLI